MRLFILLFIFSISLSVDAQEQIAVTEDSVYKKVDTEASFPGGNAGWVQYLKSTLNASTPVDKGAPAGRYNVIIRFVVNKEGEISGISPSTKYGYGMEEEVVRIIKKGPKWIPAIKDGKTVNAYRRQLVTFVVSNG